MLKPQLSLRPIKSPDESPIFIIGTGRSGTTLLRQMLTAHPRIHITHEASFYSYARHAPAGMKAAEWLDLYFQTFSFAWMRLDPQVVRRALPAGWEGQPVAAITGEVARVIMRCKAQQQHKPRYGDKNPLDTHNLQRIFADFPDARIVYIMRDPRPTVMSFNRMPFGTSSTLVNSWICKVQFAHVQPYLDRILEVRLEDLAADARPVLQSILNFVGEPWDDAVLDYVHHANLDDVPPLPWFVGATRELPSQKTSGGGWLERLDPAWIRIIEDLNRAAMQHYGYAPAALSPEPTHWQRFLTFLRDVPGLLETGYRVVGFRRKLDRHFRNIQRLDPQQGMEANLGLNPAAWRHYPEFAIPTVPRLAAVGAGDSI